MNNADASPNPERRGAAAPASLALKHSLAGLAGASIEWYDFLLYGTAAAVVFPTLFFPPGLSPFLAVMASFSTFAVGFVARPIGAILFGQLGDRLGRKIVFCAALIMMGCTTTLIGCLPTYHAAGAWAPAALVLLRLLQGLAVGGQWGGATLLATEGAPKDKRGLYGSIAQLGFPLGAVLANLALLIANGVTSSADFLDYGWRFPFLFSVVLIGVGLFIHFRVEDTAADLLLQKARRSAANVAAGAVTPAPIGRSPILQALRVYPKLILLAAGANIGGGLATYVLITYAVAYGTSAGGLQLPRGTMLAAVLIAQILCVPFIILSGALSDRFGRWRIYMIGAALSGLWSFAFFPILETRSFLWITVAICVGLGVWTLNYGPIAAMYAELFKARMRYSAVSLTYQLASIIGGGVGPILASALYAHFHSNFWVSVLIAGACAFSLVCASLLCNRPQEPMLE